MAEVILDATDAAIGRLATYAAKQALLGRKVIIINCNEAIVTGRQSALLEVYKTKIARGGYAQKGPYFSKTPERLAKRTIRGMLPWKRTRGKDAFKLIKCFNETPAEYSGKDKITFKKAKSPNLTLKRLLELA